MFSLMLFALVGASSAPSKEPSELEILVNRYAAGRCLVEKNGAIAEKILAALPESADELIIFATAGTDNKCFDVPRRSKWKIGENVTRGAIVEALLLRDFREIGVKRQKSVVPIFKWGSPQASNRPAQVRMLAFIEVAECAVLAAPEKSFQIFRTSYGSSAEKAAVMALVPEIGSCVPQDVQLPLTVSFLRTILAEGTYRVSAQQASKGS